LDATLVFGDARIQAHKAVLISFSPFLHTMFTGGLSESSQDEVELRDVDGGALAIVVSCFYTGRIDATSANVCGLIRTANLMQVNAIELAAAGYFVKQLQPNTARGRGARWVRDGAGRRGDCVRKVSVYQ
jgi:hypothetical protein